MRASVESQLHFKRMLGRVRNEFQETDKVSITVSRLDVQKGVDNAINALALLDDSHKLMVVGTGAELPKLRELAAKLGIEDRVRFMGELDRDDVAESLLAADAFVFPVRNAAREGLPIAVLEAVAAGLPPVVPNDSGWPAELVPSLIYTDVENPKALADAITRAVDADRVTLPPTFTMEGMAAAYAKALLS